MAALRTVRFGNFEANLRTHELTRFGRRLRLAEKPFLVLVALLERPGELVTREDIRRRLWPADTFVDFDNNLNSAMATLREVLGDSARAPQYIETLPRLGYRLIVKVEFVGAEVTDVTPRPHPPAVAWRPLVIAAFGGLALITFVLLQPRLSLRSSAVESPSVANPAALASPPGFGDAVYLIQRDETQGLLRATEILRSALERDALHAPSHAALAEAWVRLALRGEQAREGYSRAESAARRALSLNPEDASSHRTLALVHLHRDWNFTSAAQAAQRAVALQPDAAPNQLVAATVHAAAGRFDEAISCARRAIRLDPANWRVRADLAFFLLAGGHLEEAAAESRAVLTLDPANRIAQDFLLLASERLGRFEDARAAALLLMESGRVPRAEREAVKNTVARQGVSRYRAWQVRVLEERAQTADWPPMTRAAIYASAGRADRAFEWLERAYGARDAALALVTAHPDFVGVRTDPRFARLARLIGVPRAVPALTN